MLTADQTTVIEDPEPRTLAELANAEIPTWWAHPDELLYSGPGACDFRRAVLAKLPAGHPTKALIEEYQLRLKIGDFRDFAERAREDGKIHRAVKRAAKQIWERTCRQ